MESTRNEPTQYKPTLKSGQKYVRISEQLKYLKAAKDQNFLPRGIAEQMKYVSPIHDIQLQSSLQEYMYFCGSRILDLLIVYYTTWVNNLGKKILYKHSKARRRYVTRRLLNM